MAICKCSKSKVTEKDGLLQMESALIYQDVQKVYRTTIKKRLICLLLSAEERLWCVGSVGSATHCERRFYNTDEACAISCTCRKRCGRH